MPGLRFVILASALVLTGLVAACAPELNWRVLRLPEIGLQVMLPCKAARHQRTVPASCMANHPCRGLTRGPPDLDA